MLIVASSINIKCSNAYLRVTVWAFAQRFFIHVSVLLSFPFFCLIAELIFCYAQKIQLDIHTYYYTNDAQKSWP
jgi:hypothetical protein